MTKYRYTSLFSTLFILLCANLSMAEDIHKKSGTTSAAFLKVDAASRPISMGGAFTGLADDVNALFWNPAGLMSLQKQQISAMQNFSIGNVYTQALSYGRVLNQKMAIGVSLQGAFTRIDFRQAPTATPDQEVTVGGFAPGFSLAYQPFSFFSVGITTKAIVEQLDVETLLGFAGDLGILIRPFGEATKLGVSLQNLGSINSGSSLPTNLRSGISFQPTKANVLVADINLPLVAGYPSVHFGAENWFGDFVAVRLGYSVSQGENPRNGITAGIGLKRKGRVSLENIHFQFDYAIVPDPMGNVHRIACLMRF